MDQYDYVRTAERVYGKTIKEIARETGHSKNTVKKVLKGQPCTYKQRQKQVHPVLGQYQETIDNWLLDDKNKPKKQRHTATRIYHRLKNEFGFSGSDRTVRHYVRIAKVNLGISSKKVFIPLEPDAGREAEVDWGQAKAVIDGQEVIIKFFCMRSKYSGKHFVRCYLCERQQALFDAHIHAFKFFGGIFPVLIYDNLTTVVQKILLGKERILQEEYKKFKAYYNFTAHFCNPGSGHEKGAVEGLVGYARRNYLVPIPQVESLQKLNENILHECLLYGEHRISGREKTVNEYFEEEKNCLLSVPELDYDNIKTFSGKVNKYSTLIIDKNHYSTPAIYCGLMVNALLYVDHIEIYFRSKLISTHERLYNVNNWSLQPGHYLKLIQQRPESFDSARPIKNWRKDWPEGLEKLRENFCDKQTHTNGIKDFISVLMLYEEYERQEVDMAVQKALNAGVSTSEGVKYILKYLNKGSQESVLPLRNWMPTIKADVTVYEELGGRV